jgi:hypothetical protein
MQVAEADQATQQEAQQEQAAEQVAVVLVHQVQDQELVMAQHLLVVAVAVDLVDQEIMLLVELVDQE